jgi:serine/threonine protein kinase
MAQFPFPLVESVSRLYEVDQLFDFVSSGTFATVYRGVRRETCGRMHAGQVVALKVINKQAIKDERQRLDVENEVWILRGLDHENCVRLLDVFQTPCEVCLVLEFVAGKELFTAVSTTKALPEWKIKSILRQIFSALKYLHGTKKIVHRDLKPENILITDLSPSAVHVTVVDFGLAKTFGHRRPAKRLLMGAGGFQSHAPRPSAQVLLTSPFLTRSTSLESVESNGSHGGSPMLTTPCGTLKYAAPETVRGLVNGAQVETTRAALPKIDTFAVGLMAYVMLGGQMPYNTKVKAALAAEMEQGPKFVGPRWAGVSAEAKALILQLLSPDITQRLTAELALEHPWLALPRRIGEDEDVIPPFEKQHESCQEAIGDSVDDASSARTELRTAFSAILDEESEPTLSAPPPLVLPSQFSPHHQPQVVSTYFPFLSSK